MFDVEVMLIIAMLMSHLALAQTNGNQFPKAWPEDIVPLHEMTSACYGPGTHEQLRPTCPYNNTIIAVWGVFVGAKQKSDNCPTSVIEWDGNLVDPFNLSRVVDQNTCCFPDEDKDCIFTHGNNDLAFAYYVTSSGYHDALSSLEITWSETKCNDSSFMETTNFMFMNISCIERDRIGFLCTNNSYTTTGEPFYLYNNEYPDPTTSSYGLCRCQVRTSSPSIVLQTLDVRLEEDDAGCGQALRLTDNTTAVEWNCSTAPIFNTSQFTFSNNVNVTFTNEPGHNGSHVWIGFYDPTTSPMQITCEYETTPSPLTTSTTSLVSTPILSTKTTEQTDSTTGHPTATSESKDTTSGSSDETSGHSFTSTRPSVDSTGTSTTGTSTDTTGISTDTTGTSSVTAKTSTVTTETSTFTARTSAVTSGTSTVKAGTSTDTARTSSDTAGSASRDPATSIEIPNLVIDLLIAVLLLLLVAIVIFSVVQIVKCYRGRKSKVQPGNDLETQRENRVIAGSSGHSSPERNTSQSNYSNETIPMSIYCSSELRESEILRGQSNNHVSGHGTMMTTNVLSCSTTSYPDSGYGKVSGARGIQTGSLSSSFGEVSVRDDTNNSHFENRRSENGLNSPKHESNELQLTRGTVLEDKSDHVRVDIGVQVDLKDAPLRSGFQKDLNDVSPPDGVSEDINDESEDVNDDSEDESDDDFEDICVNVHSNDAPPCSGFQKDLNDVSSPDGVSEYVNDESEDVNDESEDESDDDLEDICVNVHSNGAPPCSGFQKDLNDVSPPDCVTDDVIDESEDESNDNQQAAAATNDELHLYSSEPHEKLNPFSKKKQKKKRKKRRKRSSRLENSVKGSKPPKSARKKKT